MSGLYHLGVGRLCSFGGGSCPHRAQRGAQASHSGFASGRAGLAASQAAGRTASISRRCHIEALCVGAQWRAVHGPHGSRRTAIATRATSITSLGSDSTNGAPAPLRYTWADDGDRLQVVELQPAGAQEGAQQLQGLLSALEAAASSGGSGRSALLSPASQQQLLLLLQPLLPALTVPSATRLFTCYQSLGIPTGPYVASVASGAAAAGAKPGEPSASSSSGIGSGSSAAEREWLATSDALVSCALQRLDGGSLQQAGAVELSELLWALSELDHMPCGGHGGGSSSSSASASSTSAADAFLVSAQQALRHRVESQDFLAPALAKAVCGLGSLVAERRQQRQDQQLQQQQQAGGGGGGGMGGGGSGSSNDTIDLGLVKALFEEARYQLVEFGSDFSATDLARLTSGMADLRMARMMDEEFRRVLMKAVYGRTRSIAEKGAVDFALKKLYDDEEARSMHFDTRWTHEELSWLPRRERDKRRIMQEHWLTMGRTQWGGWAG